MSAFNFVVYNKPDELKFNVSTKKGQIESYTNKKNFTYYELEVRRMYGEVSGFEPLENMPHPYYFIRFLLKNNIILSRMQKTGTVSKYYDSFVTVIKKRIEAKFFKIFDFFIDTSNWDLYFNLIKNNVNYNCLFIDTDFYQSGIQDFVKYRETHSNYYADRITHFTLDFHNIRGEKAKNPQEDYDYQNFMENYPNINHKNFEDNLCDWNNVKFLLNNISEKLNFIDINLQIMYYPMKNFRQYLNNQLIFNLIIFSFHVLDVKGDLKLPLYYLDNRIIRDIITILKYYFDEVNILKPYNIELLYPYKFIICKNFKGISDTDLKKLIKTSTKWYSLEPTCGLIKNIDKDKYYVNSILKEDTNFNDLEYFYLREIELTLEELRKIKSIYLQCTEDNRTFFNLSYKLLRRSYKWLDNNKLYNIINLEGLDKNILKLDICFNFSNSFYQFSNFINDKNQLKIRPSEVTEIDIDFYRVSKQYNIPNLLDYERQLVIIKRSLDNLDQEKYYRIDKQIRPFLPLRYLISEKFTHYKVSQGFIKMYEILSLFNLLPMKNSVKTFHSCEAPGQFILAVNHYIKTKTNIKNFTWNAQSLISKERRSLGDDYGIIKNNLDKWDFGISGDGDVTLTENIKYYEKYLSEADLVTFDCGIAFTDNLKQTYQDRSTSLINYSQLLMILNALKIKGNFVIKVFLPQTLPYIISLNYILSLSFEELSVYKSFQNTTSSEVYIIGKYFKGISEKTKKYLFDFKEELDNDTSIIPIPEDFLKEYQDIFVSLLERNINSMKKVIYYYKNDNLLNKKKIKKFQMDNCNEWINFFDIKKIKKTDIL